MKTYFAFETKLFLKNKKNQFLFLGVFVLLISLLFYISFQNVNDIAQKTKLEASTVRNAISYVPTHEIEEEPYTEKYPFYQHLLQESRAVASQEVALTMHNDLDNYVDAGLEVTDVRIQAHEDGYGTLPKEFLIPLSQSLKEREVYQYLQDNNLQIEPDAQNGANFLSLSVTWFSAISFFFLLLLFSDVLLQDEEHKTIIDAYPIDANQKVTGKMIIQTSSTTIILAVLFAIGYLLARVIFRPGTLNYPEAIYWRGTYSAIPTYRYILLFFLMLFVFIIHLMLLSAVLNVVFKNKYLNIFIGGSLYVLGFLFSAQVPLLHFTPISYLNPLGVLNGRLAEQYNQPSNDAVTALIVLIAWSVIYGIVLSVMLSRKNRVAAETTVEGIDAR